MVIHQVAMPRIECKEQEQADICLKPGCRLVSNNTDCLTTDIPTEVSSSSRDKLVLPSCSSFLWSLSSLVCFDNSMDMTENAFRCDLKTKSVKSVKKGEQS